MIKIYSNLQINVSVTVNKQKYLRRTPFLCILIKVNCNFCFSIRFLLDRDVIAETRKLRVNINDFTIKSIIGKGHFGDVHLATENITNDIYAIKKMPKSSYSHAKEERNIMAMSNSEWIPTLQYAFQVNCLF